MKIDANFRLASVVDLILGRTAESEAASLARVKATLEASQAPSEQGTAKEPPLDQVTEVLNGLGYIKSEALSPSDDLPFGINPELYSGMHIFRAIDSLSMRDAGNRVLFIPTANGQDGYVVIQRSHGYNIDEDPALTGEPRWQSGPAQTLDEFMGQLRTAEGHELPVVLPPLELRRVLWDFKQMGLTPSTRKDEWPRLFVRDLGNHLETYSILMEKGHYAVSCDAIYRDKHISGGKVMQSMMYMRSPADFTNKSIRHEEEDHKDRNILGIQHYILPREQWADPAKGLLESREMVVTPGLHIERIESPLSRFIEEGKEAEIDREFGIPEVDEEPAEKVTRVRRTFGQYVGSLFTKKEPEPQPAQVKLESRSMESPSKYGIQAPKTRYLARAKNDEEKRSPIVTLGTLGM